MFKGTKLVRKSLIKDAKDMYSSAKEAKNLIGGVSVMNAPDITVGIPPLNVDIFKGINLKKLINMNLRFCSSVPKINLIPDVKLGEILEFNLSKVLLNLKGILKYKGLFPNISLRTLVWSICVKYPHLNLPAIAIGIDIGKIFEIDFPNLPIFVPQVSLDVPKVNPGEMRIPGIDLQKL